MDIEARLRRLEAVDEIRHMVARMRRSADEGNDMASIAMFLAEDCVYRTIGGARLLGQDLLLEGRDAMVAAGADIAQNLIVACWHNTSPVEIMIHEDGCTASVQWYLYEIARQPSEDGHRLNILGGWYNGKLRFEDRWRFNALDLVIKFSGAAPSDWQWM